LSRLATSGNRAAEAMLAGQARRNPSS